VQQNKKAHKQRLCGTVGVEEQLLKGEAACELPPSYRKREKKDSKPEQISF
jgi:hypothetical protein